MPTTLPEGASTVLTTLTQLAAMANEIANENQERYLDNLGVVMGAAHASQACWRHACEEVALEVYPYTSADWEHQARVDVLRDVLGRMLTTHAEFFRSESRCVNALPG